MARPGSHTRPAMGPSRGAAASGPRPHDREVRRPCESGDGGRPPRIDRTGVGDSALAIGTVQAPRPDGGVRVGPARARSRRCTLELRADHAQGSRAGRMTCAEAITHCCSANSATSSRTVMLLTSPASWAASAQHSRASRPRTRNARRVLHGTARVGAAGCAPSQAAVPASAPGGRASCLRARVVAVRCPA